MSSLKEQDIAVQQPVLLPRRQHNKKNNFKDEKGTRQQSHCSDYRPRQ
jgi:hypothetical protein